MSFLTHIIFTDYRKAVPSNCMPVHMSQTPLVPTPTTVLPGSAGRLVSSIQM